MSCGCMFVLRNVGNIEMNQLHSKLICAATECNCGLCFEPVNNLLLERTVCLSENDFAFEICDNFCGSDASLLLSHEGYSVNGVQARLSLMQRLLILQKIAFVCVSYAELIEIYLGEDTPFLPDYADYCLEIKDIANVLYREYQKECALAYMPCVHLVVEK